VEWENFGLGFGNVLFLVNNFGNKSNSEFGLLCVLELFWKGFFWMKMILKEFFGKCGM